MMRLRDKPPNIMFAMLLALFLCSRIEVNGFAAIKRRNTLNAQLNDNRYNEQILRSRYKADSKEVHQNNEAHYNIRTIHAGSSKKRRSFLTLMTLLSTTQLTPKPSNAIPFFQSNHRQLELCLVTILRTQYWAMNIAKSLKLKLLTPTEASELLDDNVRKLPYLEARLGAKALLTQKIGGGATTTVLKLASFNIKECLDDGKYWCNQLVQLNQLSKPICNNNLSSITADIIESLASIVEFDGLETTIDPSPRSSLMLSMYTPQKGTFVYRTLTERVIPSCEAYLDLFGDEKRKVCLEFVRRDYSDEIPFEVLQSFYDEEET